MINIKYSHCYLPKIAMFINNEFPNTLQCCCNEDMYPCIIQSGKNDNTNIRFTFAIFRIWTTRDM